MQMTEICRSRHVWLDLQWRRRDQNVEADALTNCVFEGFDMSKRRTVSWPMKEFEVLNQFLASGVALYKQVQTLRKQVLLTPSAQFKASKRRKEDRLSVRDPW